TARKAHSALSSRWRITRTSTRSVRSAGPPCWRLEACEEIPDGFSGVGRRRVRAVEFAPDDGITFGAALVAHAAAGLVVLAQPITPARLHGAGLLSALVTFHEPVATLAAAVDRYHGIVITVKPHDGYGLGSAVAAADLDVA